MTHSQEPVYPMLVVHPMGLYVMGSDVEQCSQLSYKKGYYNAERLSFFDFACQAWKLSHAEKLGGAGLFWGYNLFFNRQLRVRLHFTQPPELLPFDVMKERIVELCRKMRGQRRAKDRNRIIAVVKGSKNMSDLLRSLAVEDDYIVI